MEYLGGNTPTLELAQAYEAPSLVVLGTLEELTLGSRFDATTDLVFDGQFTPSDFT